MNKHKIVGRNLLLANRLHEVFISGHWIANTNYKDQIESLNREDAVQKVESLNSIAALVFHINYYVEGMLNAFEKGKLNMHDKYSFDLPSMLSEEEWTKLKLTFLSNTVAFANYVEQMEEDRFDQPFFDEKYGTVQRNIEGVLEHSYYHLGQISLIRKLIGGKNA
ncbi:MAG: DinB family protein [Bacteroidia bacterium]|jgi:uncharacterized damage-inducible protein DinB